MLSSAGAWRGGDVVKWENSKQFIPAVSEEKVEEGGVTWRIYGSIPELSCCTCGREKRNQQNVRLLKVRRVDAMLHTLTVGVLWHKKKSLSFRIDMVRKNI